MTNDQLFDLVNFDENINSVEILSQEEVEHDGIFIRAKLHTHDDELIVPFVYYKGNNWIFTPCDWQGQLPVTKEEIDSCDWRVDNSDTEAIFFDGLPMLSPLSKNPDEDIRIQIGKKIRKARLSKGLTVRNLADKVGVAHSHIVRIENGKYNLTIETLYKIANALGLCIDLIDE